MSINTVYCLVVSIIGLCIPVYFLVSRKKFALYLVVLFCGSLMQKGSALLIYPYSPKFSMMLWEIIGVAISLSLILFILRQYISLQVLKEKRFIIFVVTAILGIGLRMLESYNDSAVWLTALAYYISIAILGIGFLMTQNLKSFIKQDWGILLTIVIGALIYIALYQFYKEQSFFYMAWLLVMGLQVATWLFIGLWHLNTRNAKTRLRSSFHQKIDNLLPASHSFNLLHDPIKSGTVDRW